MCSSNPAALNHGQEVIVFITKKVYLVCSSHLLENGNLRFCEGDYRKQFAHKPQRTSLFLTLDLNFVVFKVRVLFHFLFVSSVTRRRLKSVGCCGISHLLVFKRQPYVQ
jgi:hypothetical protein